MCLCRLLAGLAGLIICGTLFVIVAIVCLPAALILSVFFIGMFGGIVNSLTGK